MTKIKTLALTTAVGGLMAFGASAQAATVFSATIEGEQSTTPPATVSEDLNAQASLTLNETSPGVYALSMAVDFSEGFDFSSIVGSGQIDEVVGEPGDVSDAARDVIGFHIHDAPRGVAGPIVFGLFDVIPGTPVTTSDVDDDTVLTYNDDGSVSVVSVWESQEGTSDGVLADFVGELLAAVEGEDVSLYFNLHTEDAPMGLIRGQIVAENSLGSDVVPLPAAAALFVPALAAGGFLRRRKAQA